MKLNHWVVVVRVHPSAAMLAKKRRSDGGLPEYSEELGAGYVADVAPALVRKVELGEYCVLPDWSIAEVYQWYPNAQMAQWHAQSLRELHPNLDIRELVTAE